MNKIILTGATGFVGSALAATLLSRGATVLAVSRNDQDGCRTETAVREAAAGCGLDLGAAIRDRLVTFDAGQGPLADALDADSLQAADAVWHCAAEMSYSANKLAHAYQTNVCGTVDLYRKVAAHAPACKRFYYVSTAYTAGIRGGNTDETLHVGNPCVNSYQVTKWCAEQSLSVLHQEGALPVAIFRPTIVVGHAQTGWARRNGFGFYMFVDAIEAVRRAGASHARLNLPGDVKPDLVTVDRVVDDMAGLTSRENQGAAFEVFHCSGGRELNNRQLLSIISETTGVRATHGPPMTLHDQRIDRAIDANRLFASTDWTFNRTSLDAALKRESRSTPVDKDLLARLVDWYRSEVPLKIPPVAGQLETQA
ncbi:NAD-dependent epimerase/dehydratase family protein [Paraburkholderia sp. GAS348]|uniref:NAD-dependent epimerase/dehydratase family protein n=1 Tax=Paraburkholderia sp. GAS348 TaxID=3035132 RepID=UPI003D2157D9